MKIILQTNLELLTFELPSKISGNYWISNSKRDNLVNIEAENEKWVLKSNVDVKILKDINYKENELLTNVNQEDFIILNDYMSFYIYELVTKKVYKVFCMPIYDFTMMQLVIDFTKTKEIVIGNNNKATINCSLSYFSKEQILISFENNLCKVKNNNINIPMYINNILETEKYLSNGDMIFIDGLMICVIGNLFMINNPNNIIFYDSLKLAKRLLPTNLDRDYSNEQESFVEVFNKSEYFQRPPRFKRIIEEKEYNIDPPTSIQDNDEMPLIYTLGPMMLMAMTSFMSGMTAINNVITGKETFKENMSSILMTVSMLGGTFIFPLLQRHYKKRSINRNEKKRRRKYKKYIDKKRNEILQEIEIQRQILIENNLGLEDVAKISLNKSRTLWDRKLDHPDFLDIRLGVGTVKPNIKLNIPEEHFTMDEDDLRDVYNELFEAVKDIENVPVVVNLIEKNITGIVGNYSYVKKFLDGVMLQLLTYHSYDMLKIVIITSNEKRNTWEKYKNVPHFWNNEKSVRFIGIDIDDISKVSNSLMLILNERISDDEDKDKNEENIEKYKNYKEYYLIISDEVDRLKNTSIYNELIKQKINYGFSMLLITDKIDNLPNECFRFINVEPNNSGVFINELLSTNQNGFTPDIPNFDINLSLLSLCNIPIDIAAGKYELPSKYSFLEMYDVGNVKQLNILNRWKNNNPIQSLSVPVGVNEQGELFKIDLHEKYHGPHGLVAGMTGSGKSEWIITYILSMCVNYHPDEVQFVLIDYKGGGLAGTFENKETGFKLPHLAGTITNLDIAEINRSLASINSELKRRQALFNQARDKLGESSVDIYKYQRWYREGKIDEPISHLFLISDEFAELKSQQPEFMAELISTARIGRSLGVHLILATQKPSGVVDDQIWSNSKFRVCLKVQEKSDSKDMILVSDAALLKEAGRFYLQVGYNEFFAKGQSAYAGCPYYESDKHKKTVDTDLIFVNDIGETYKEINSEKKVVSAVFKGEELPNVLKEILLAAEQSELHVKQLWLDAIPSHIYITDLLKKYNYKKESFKLNPVIGVYDAPQYQKQDILTLPLSEKGNTLIYGVAGSGKENLLTTLIYSLMTTYFSNEVNLYLIDCGAEVLNCFKSSPIVGDIINGSDEEKVGNYFKFIYEEYEKRKQLFQDYNGDYYYYSLKSGNKLPIILTIINNYDNYNEIYGETYSEILIKITREAEKCGILFIITSNTVNSIRYKLSQNFKQSICLQMNDNYDYRTIFGNKCKTVPASHKGRGIVEINEEFYEFQTAYPVDDNDLVGYLTNLSKILLNKYGEKAKPISVLPSVVNFDYVKDYLNNLIDLPIGVYANNLEIVQYNFLGKYFNIITGNDNDYLKPFINGIVDLISSKKETLKVIIYDASEMFDDLRDNVTYINNNFYSALEQFDKFLDKVNEKTKQSLVIFSGYKNIISSDPEISDLLITVFGKINRINKFNVLFVDNMNDISIYLRNRELSSFINNDNGIYIGNGIDNQYVINIKKVTRDMRQEISDDMGYIIIKGKEYLFKVLTK